MLFRRRQVLAVFGGLIVIVVTMVVTLRERTVFVSKCAMNNNAFTDCWCTFNALSDLSPNYRHLATSWAHDTGVTYATNVMYVVGAEAIRASKGRMSSILGFKDKQQAIRAWIWEAGNILGWHAVKAASATVAAKLAGPMTAAPILYDATTEYVKARAAIDRSCSTGRDTFVTQIDRARVAVETSAASFTDEAVRVLLQTGSTTVETTTSVGGAAWRKFKALFGK